MTAALRGGANVPPMMRLALLLLLAAPALAGDAEIDRLVDRLFDADAEARAAARRELLALGEGTLEKVLARIEARRPAGNVVRIHAVQDLRVEEKWWKLALVRIKTAAHGADQLQLHEENGALLVVAPVAVQERVAGELAALRRFLGRVVTVEVRVVQIGAAPPHLPAEIAADGLVEFLEKHSDDVTTAPRLTCRNGQTASVEVVKEVSYVADFDVEVADDAFLADPVVEVLQTGLVVKLRPVAGDDGVVAVSVEARHTDLARPIPTMKLPMPAGPAVEIQVPETRSTVVTRLVACKPGRLTVVDAGGGRLLLLGAEAFHLDDASTGVR